MYRAAKEKVSWVETGKAIFKGFLSKLIEL